MPRGVTDQFLRILRAERRVSLRTLALAPALLPVAYFMAELTDEPRFGWIVLLTGLATLGGLAAGLGLGAWRTRAYNRSLQGNWNAWMRMSVSCGRVDEVARHVAQASAPRSLAGVAWGALLVLNALLFAALWFEAPWALAYGALLASANGLLLGGMAGLAAWNLRWAARFHRALDELIREGQVGLWGEV